MSGHVSADEDLLGLAERCSNWGRWGSDDEIGTLNFITPGKRVAAAQLVRLGHAVSISRRISTTPDAVNVRPLRHNAVTMKSPDFVGDSIELACHGAAFTHLDALAHVSWEGMVYNGRALAGISDGAGLAFGSINAQQDGVFTRGVLLDVAGARDIAFLG